MSAPDKHAPGTLKQRAITGMFWKLLENGGTTAITFITTTLLARLLDPSHYAVLSVTVIFVSLSAVFVQRGFSLALVQKTDADDTDFSTVFYFTLVLCAALYALLWFASPLIAQFYQEPQVKPVLRAMALILFPCAVSSLQYAVVMREFAFRKRFVVSLIASVLSGTAGVTLALMGYGVWALVARQLIDDFTMCIGLSIVTGWRPKWLFSFSRLKTLLSFGWKLLASGFMETLYGDLSSLVIGKRFSTTKLAFYDKGRRFPMNITTTLTGAIQAAMFPSFADAQHERDRLLAMVRRCLSTSAFLIAPLMAGLAAVSVPLVRLLLLEKWLPCAPFLIVFCVTYAMYPIDASVTQSITAMGRSDVYLKLEIAKKATGLGFIACAVFLLDTPLALAWALSATAVAGLVYNAVPIRRLMGYRYGDQIKDMLPSFGLSIMMGAMVYLITFLRLPDAVTLAIQIPLGVALYAGAAWLFRLDSMRYVLVTLGEIRQKKAAKRRQHTEDEEK